MEEVQIRILFNYAESETETHWAVFKMFRAVIRSHPVRLFSTSRSLYAENLLKTLDVLSGVGEPLNNVQSVTNDGFIFSEGILVKNKTVLLLANRILEFSPKYEIKNGFIVEFDEKSLDFLKLINPQPDLFIIGLGQKSRLLSQLNSEFLNSLGIRVDVSDTRGAVRNFDLLATERPNQVAAILLPPNV